MKREKTVAAYTCDCCDKAFQDEEERVRQEVEMIREVADD